MELRGDMKFHKETFRFIRSRNQNACCERCLATKSEKFVSVNGNRVNTVFADFGDDPGWSHTELSHSAWLKDCWENLTFTLFRITKGKNGAVDCCS